MRCAAESYADNKEEKMDSLEMDKFLAYIENEIEQEMRNEHAEENYRSGLL